MKDTVQELFEELQMYAKEHNYPLMQRALLIMKEYHAGAFRRGNAHLPYIVHPMTIAKHGITLGIGTDELLAVCLLHDVLEDTSAEEEDLQMPSVVVEAVKLLTFDETCGQTKEAAKAVYFQQIGDNSLATLVKILDRVNNVSTMADGFTQEKMASYIQETKEYIYPLLDRVKEEYTRFLLSYHLHAVVNSLEKILF